MKKNLQRLFFLVICFFVTTPSGAYYTPVQEDILIIESLGAKIQEIGNQQGGAMKLSTIYEKLVFLQNEMKSGGLSERVYSILGSLRTILKLYIGNNIDQMDFSPYGSVDDRCETQVPVLGGIVQASCESSLCEAEFEACPAGTSPQAGSLSCVQPTGKCIRESGNLLWLSPNELVPNITKNPWCSFAKTYETGLCLGGEGTRKQLEKIDICIQSGGLIGGLGVSNCICSSSHTSDFHSYTDNEITKFGGYVYQDKEGCVQRSKKCETLGGEWQGYIQGCSIEMFGN